eukprot:gene4471-16342_t
MHVPSHILQLLAVLLAVTPYAVATDIHVNNNVLEINPGNGLSAAVSGSLHVTGRITLNGRTSADAKVDVQQALDRCSADFEAMETKVAKLELLLPLVGKVAELEEALGRVAAFLQRVFKTPGSHEWVAPEGVRSISVVAVGAGGGQVGERSGGGGGALSYANNIEVVPGSTYQVVIGSGSLQNGVSTKLTIGTSVVVEAGTGKREAAGVVIVGTGFPGGHASSCGGGGAGGYSGAGGASEATGAGGGGGGGANGWGNSCGGGGAVGLLGEGASGEGVQGGNQERGHGGSGGAGGANYGSGASPGGGGGSVYNGGDGALRIIWPGTTRSFPATNTGDL